MIVVYDFDKTLTYKDTLFMFFKHCAKKNIFYPFKITLYIFMMVMSKVKLISNKELKKVGIRLFLKSLSKSALEKKSILFRDKIPFNKVYKDLKFNKQNSNYIVSASFEEYLRPLFPKFVKILASQILYKENRVNTILFNCYKENKILALNEIKIDLLYTDSFSDYPLAKISNQIFVVDGDSIIKCKNIKSFKEYFKQ